jgi:prephenate dehydratase
MNKIAYLGPEGTFTQQALIAFDPDAAACPMASVDAALAAVGAGEVDAAMVPIESSVEGGVPATLDALAAADAMLVVSEQLTPVRLVLAARPRTRLEDVRHVGTHPHAWAQVRRFAHSRMPCAVHVPTLSTAAGAAALASGAAAYDATVCAPVAAANHRLEVLAEDIGDSKVAVTRFVVVAQLGAIPPPTGADKTTIVVFQREDRAGGLLELLEQFAARGINIIRIESRPTGAAMGSYCFSIDFEGHVRDERVGEALMGLRRLAADMRFLGSYPRADRRQAQIEEAVSDPTFIEARAWLRSLRSGAAGCQLRQGDIR